MHDHDQVDLVCPQAASPAQVQDGARNGSGTAADERYIIYSVSIAQPSQETRVLFSQRKIAEKTEN